MVNWCGGWHGQLVCHAQGSGPLSMFVGADATNHENYSPRSLHHPPQSMRSSIPPNFHLPTSQKFHPRTLTKPYQPCYHPIANQGSPHGPTPAQSSSFRFFTRFIVHRSAPGGRQNHEYHWSPLENYAKNALFEITVEYHWKITPKARFRPSHRVRKIMSICGEICVFRPKTHLFAPTLSTCGEYL